MKTLAYRLKRYIGWLLAGWIALDPVIALAANEAPSTFTPSGKWQLVGDDGRCTLHRDFVSGTKKLHLSIEVMTLDNSLELVLKTEAHTNTVRIKPGKVDFTDGRPTEAVFVETLGTSDGQAQIDRFTVSKDQFARAIATRRIAINFGGRSVQLDLPDLEPAVKYLGNCENALVQSVGVPPEEVAAIARPAKKPPLLIRYGPEYFDLVRKGDPEDVAVSRSIVSPEGKLIQCALVHRAASSALNGQACHDWGPLQITPAQDKDGKKVRGIIFERRRWVQRDESSR